MRRVTCDVRSIYLPLQLHLCARSGQGRCSRDTGLRCKGVQTLLMPLQLCLTGDVQRVTCDVTLLVMSDVTCDV